MNDRLMLAVMVTNGLLSSGRLSSLNTNRIAADALLMADALLAAAGEQETTKYSPVSIVDQPVSRAEYDRQVARSEAAEAKVAELEAKLAAAADLARDSAVAAGEMVDGGVRLTNEQAVIVSAYTGVLICDFADMQRAVEAKLGRPVWTHEFADSGTTKMIKDAFREDFLALAPQEAAHD